VANRHCSSSSRSRPIASRALQPPKKTTVISPLAPFGASHCLEMAGTTRHTCSQRLARTSPPAKTGRQCLPPAAPLPTIRSSSARQCSEWTGRGRKRKLTVGGAGLSLPCRASAGGCSRRTVAGGWSGYQPSFCASVRPSSAGRHGAARLSSGRGSAPPSCDSSDASALSKLPIAGHGPAPPSFRWPASTAALVAYGCLSGPGLADLPICAANSELLFAADQLCAARLLRPQNLKTRHVAFGSNTICSTAGPTVAAIGALKRGDHDTCAGLSKILLILGRLRRLLRTY
jgi:hypothetical protein